MYIAPGQGQGQTTPWGQNFYININLLSLWSFAVCFFPLGTNVDVDRNPLSLCPFVASFKTITLKSFYVFLHVYSPGQGQTTHWGHSFDDNRKAFTLCPYVASFKMITLKSDFIQ